ncbi:MAG TPA: hypothetical protein VME23_10090 [Terracidiphilus sp.]|nr:hypothetical protein [Terracidiphilus sp.]
MTIHRIPGGYGSTAIIAGTVTATYGCTASGVVRRILVRFGLPTAGNTVTAAG